MVGVKRRIGCADGGEMCDVADLYLDVKGRHLDEENSSTPKSVLRVVRSFLRAVTS